MAEQFLTIAEVRSRYRVGTSWIYGRIRNGMFPEPARFGAAVRWRESDLAKFDETLKTGIDNGRGTGRRRGAA